MKKSIALGFAALLVSAVSAQADPVNVFTNFTIPADTPNSVGFSIESDPLGSIESLALGGTNFGVVYEYFTPTVSGTYSIGIASAAYDPVLIVYEDLTSFYAGFPGGNAIAFNNDGQLLSFNGLPISSAQNPIIQDILLVAGTNYLVAATSYWSETLIPLPLTFFVYGPEQVGVAGVAPIPEPSSYAGIAGALALGVVGAGRRRRAVRA